MSCQRKGATRQVSSAQAQLSKLCEWYGTQMCTGVHSGWRVGLCPHASQVVMQVTEGFSEGVVNVYGLARGEQLAMI